MGGVGKYQAFKESDSTAMINKWRVPFSIQVRSKLTKNSIRNIDSLHSKNITM